MKELLYENLELGRFFPVYKHTVTNEEIKRFAEAVGSRYYLFLDEQRARDSEFGNIVIPPMMAYLLFRHSYLADATMPGGGIALKLEFEFFRTAIVNETLDTQTRVIDSNERDSKKYVTLEATTTDVDGRKVYVSRLFAIWPK